MSTVDKDWSNATDEEILNADLLIELDLVDLPEEQQAEVLRQFSSSLERAITLRILGSITDKSQQDELQKLIAANNAESVKAFIESTVPNHGEIAQEEIIKFKRIMLTESPAEREAMQSTPPMSSESSESHDLPNPVQE